MNPINYKIVLVGAGNAGTQLGLALHRAGCNICQVYSRTEISAKELADKLQVPFTTNEKNIISDADIYFFMLKDDTLPEVLHKMNPVLGLCVHISGSLPIYIFEHFSSRRGVFYPLQTFTKSKLISFRNIPVFVEATSKQDEGILFSLAGLLSDNVQILSSEQRKYIHLAAVFACNFTNHMYALGYELLQQQHISGDILRPLIEETASKIKLMPPQEAQTGPAIRCDKTIIDSHLCLLVDENKNKIYQLISESIHKSYENN